MNHHSFNQFLIAQQTRVRKTLTGADERITERRRKSVHRQLAGTTGSNTQDLSVTVRDRTGERKHDIGAPQQPNTSHAA